MQKITLPQFIKNYWDYYLELEDQLLSTKKYVDFDKSNFKTFSIEYLKLLQAACSEIDVVAKILADYCDSSFKKLQNINIQKWGLVIQQTFPDIENISVSFINDTVITPWQNWEYEKYTDHNNKQRYRLKKGKATPTWWTAYNEVKHERTTTDKNGRSNYSKANLENLTSAMAALFIIETKFIERLSADNDRITFAKSKMFSKPQTV